MCSIAAQLRLLAEMLSTGSGWIVAHSEKRKRYCHPCTAAGLCKALTAHIGRTSLQSAHSNRLRAHFADPQELLPGLDDAPYKTS
jgi:hypothetical protein